MFDEAAGHGYWTNSSLSGLVIVLTLPVNEREGLRPYLSQSEYPAKGTTVGGRTDDPRRERTRDAPARHRARRCRATSARCAASWGSRGRCSTAGANAWNDTESTACTRVASAPGRGAPWRPPRRWSGWYSGSRSAPPPGGCRRIAAYLARTWRV